MPRRELHNLLNLLLLGDTYDWLNKTVDEPWRILGRMHRILFHDEKIDPLITYMVTRDIGAALAHYLHIRLDKDKKLQKTMKKIKMILELLK